MKFGHKNWEFLGELTQRYWDDWREILWAARFIKDKTEQIYIGLPKEEAVLKVVENNYSAREHGRERVRKYLELKEIFETNNEYDSQTQINPE